MRKFTRARALTVGLALGFAAQALFAGCAQDDTNERAACQGANCAASAPPLDFSKGGATFTAHLRVLDGAGKPLAKADVQVGKSKGATDADGRVALKGVDAKSAAVVQVASKSAAPYVGKTDAFLSGQRTQQVSLGPLAFREQVDL
ncbi:MAG TPA: hypothetical protein VMF89_16140, partial [Polyangiales bacterium]|nr:hypothetical protein [Polyangiales bacterium]